MTLTCLTWISAQQPTPAPSAPAPSTSAPPASGPVYTFQAHSRIVLTDVRVTDAQGRPVTGLPETAFRILDDGKPQRIASFDEHQTPAAGSAAPVQVDASNTGNNAYLSHPPAAFDVLLIDPDTLALPDQMYLRTVLERVVRHMPPGIPLAVYVRAGLHTLELQDFTADPDRLLAAVGRAVPVFRSPDARYESDFGVLLQLMRYLEELPGRKNVLWFSGGSNLFLTPDASALPIGENLQPIYDALQRSRIAIFPIDARGLTVSSSVAQMGQQMQMRDTAEATGGAAVVNSNGLDTAAEQILRTGDDFYTLTYSPSQLKLDNKWHKVKVEIEGRYQLSYRRGYYDDGSNLVDAPPRPGRQLLTADGRTAETPPPPERMPFLFGARVSPSTGDAPVEAGAQPAPPPAHGEERYDVEFDLPANELSLQQPRYSLETGLLVLNRFGDRVAQRFQRVTIGYNLGYAQAHPQQALRYLQQIDMPAGADIVYVMVLDPVANRLGMVQVPVQVAKAPKHPAPVPAGAP